MIPIGRRTFCVGVAATAALPLSCTEPGPVLPTADPPEQMQVQLHGPAGPGAVVEVRWSRSVDPAGSVDDAIVSRMLRAALDRLFGDAPWASWATASARVGIKVNTITSQTYSHPGLARAVAARLVSGGSDPARITVWDRDTSGLTARGYDIDRTGAGGHRCLGTDSVAASKPVSAVIAGNKVYFSPLLTGSDALVSIAALKDHSMAGVSLSLKNNFGMIHGAERLHGDFRAGSGCEPGISELAAHPQVRGRLRLAIIDALVGVCEGGPGRADPAHAFRYGGLLVSRDPVALDRRGLAIIEARRASLGLVPLGRRTRPNPSPPSHIDNAAARGVGPG